MQTQYSVFGCRIHLYFHDYKLAKEVDENGHNNRNIDYEIKRTKKLIEQNHGCEFIRLDPDDEDCDLFKSFIWNILIHQTIF